MARSWLGRRQGRHCLVSQTIGGPAILRDFVRKKAPGGGGGQNRSVLLVSMGLLHPRVGDRTWGQLSTVTDTVVRCSALAASIARMPSRKVARS